MPSALWQNFRDLLHATAVTRGWNGYRNKSQQRKLTLGKKFPRSSCRGSNPGPFDHDSLTTELPLLTIAAMSDSLFEVDHSLQ